MTPRTGRWLAAILIGWGFAFGLALLIDAGTWQQPVGVSLLFLSTASLARVVIEIPVVIARIFVQGD